MTVIEFGVGSEDFVFNKEGHIIQAAIDDNTLVKKTTYDGTSEILAQLNNDWPQGTRLLPNGELIITNGGDNQLTRIYPNGSVEPFAIGISSPNGIAVNMEGIIYATSARGVIYRVDPVANTFTEVFTASDTSFDGISFSPDYQTLYFDEEMGNVHKIAVNPDGTLGQESILVDLQAFPGLWPFGLLDGMTVDECGNLYVVDMNGYIIRVTPDGDPQVAADMTEGGIKMVPAANFGSGYGGWQADHLYVISFEGNIFDIDMGVRGKPEPHL